MKELIAREADLHRRSINQEAIVLLEEALAARFRTGAHSPRQEVREVLARYRALPIRDQRGPDELIEYDKNGLPK